MRSIVLLCLLAGIARAGDLLEDSRAPTATVRADAANQIAKQLRDAASRRDTAKDDRELALIAVVSDDPVVRATLIDALVAMRVITRPAAARIPTLATLEGQLHALVKPRRDPRFVMPVATRCWVTAADARGATLQCHGSRCGGSCHHHTTDVTLRTGVQWRVVRQTSQMSDDGACGFCM